MEIGKEKGEEGRVKGKRRERGIGKNLKKLKSEMLK